MPLHVQASYSAGELDPALHERTTLHKYDSGLATARNVLIGKTGRIISRPPRKNFKKTKLSDKIVVGYSPPGSGYLLEFGHSYVRVYSISAEITTAPYGTLIGDYASAFTESMLPDLHFDSSKGLVFITCAGQRPRLFKPSQGFISVDWTPVDSAGLQIVSPNYYYTGALPYITAGTGGGALGAGYEVDYAFTAVRNGQESSPFIYYSGTSPDGTHAFAAKLPITTGQMNALFIDAGVTTEQPSEIRAYRRPKNGGAFGYIGSTSAYSLIGGPPTTNILFEFHDVGEDADYSHQPPTLNYSPSVSSHYYPKTCCVYQQRLLMANYEGNPNIIPLVPPLYYQIDLGRETIESSRTGYYQNFVRDYPISDDSALTFKSGTSGQARVLRMIVDEGLIVFTSIGVFRHSGALTPDNLSLVKKGNWIIDEAVPPLNVPGAVIFIDKKTNTVRSVSINDAGTYSADELSVFSDHLFVGRQVTSWGFHDGETPVLFVSFSDGKFASFTFEESQEMRAWTRHDSTGINVEQIVGTGIPELTYFIVEKDGERYWEVTVPRYVQAALIVDNPESVMNESYAFLDSMVSYTNCLNDSLTGVNVMALVPVYNDVNGDPDWSSDLTLTCGANGLFPSPGNGAIGAVLRYFNPDDGTTINLQVSARASNNQVTVIPDATFPSEYGAANPRIYETKSIITGLDHLEGESVSVVVDGYVAAAPFNDQEALDDIVVTGGQITLPADIGGGTGKGAIVHVGRPIIADIETLDIDTVEQRPVFIESQTVNKLYVKVHRSRGLFCGNRFVDDDLVKGDDPSKEMNDIESYDTNENFVPDEAEDDSFDLLGNKYLPPQTTRFEVTVPGDWKSQGRICLRQVDPLHFEILSIIADTQDLRR